MAETKIKIQIIEGMLNEDHDAMKALERERRETETLIEFFGREDSVNMRLYERLNQILTAWCARLQSFELRMLHLEQLRGIVPRDAAVCDVAA